MDKETRKEKRIAALVLHKEGMTVREIAKKIGYSKTRVGEWIQEERRRIAGSPVNAAISNMGNVGGVAKTRAEEAAKELAEARARGIEVRDRSAEYIDGLKFAKDRQVKWAGAVTETGIRSLKFANKFLAVLERKEELNKPELELIRLIPGLMTASASAMKSAAEAEDRAYSLELLIDTLNELPKQVKKANRPKNVGVVAPDNR